MKLWKSIIVAGAILALAASAGVGAQARMLDRSDVQVDVVSSSALIREQAKTIRSLRATKAQLVARNRVLKTTIKDQNAAIASLQERLWAATPHTPGPAVDPGQNDSECSDYLLCTPEQACRIWGDGCSAVNPPAVTPEPTNPGDETIEPVEPPVLTVPSVLRPLDCASYYDPAIVSDDPEDYDPTC